MEKYNYLDHVTTDAKEAILENMEYWSFDDREELESMANDILWVDDGEPETPAAAIIATRGRRRKLFATTGTYSRRLARNSGRTSAKRLNMA